MNWNKQHRTLYLLIIITLVGLFEPIICNSDALICRHNGKLTLFKSHSKVELNSCKAILRTVVPYSYNQLDLKNREVSPLQKQNVATVYWRHHLGTDNLGRDTLAGIIHGLKITAILALSTTFFALIIGLFFGLLASYQYFNTTRFPLWAIALATVVLCYLLFLVYYGIDGEPFNFTFILLGFIALCGFVFFETKSNLKISYDNAVSKLIEILKILPMLLILIVISGFFDKVSYVGLITIFSLLTWPSFTRLFRGEFISLSKQDFVTSSKAIGSSTTSILIKHILPNAITPLIAHICFSMIAIILLEATLSFLGIGVPVEEVSLGSLIKESRGNLGAWWLAVFPGITLYIILSNLNKLGSSYIRK